LIAGCFQAIVDIAFNCAELEFAGHRALPAKGVLYYTFMDLHIEMVLNDQTQGIA